MAQKKTKEQIRAEVEKADAAKDVNIHAAVTIAVVAGISAAAAIVAVLALACLEYFRADVSAYWLSCIPFCFPLVTGLATAYRKQLANVGIHVALAAATLLTGGAGYGSSIQPVFIERENCTLVSEFRGSCHKETLVYLYLVSGAIACGFAVLGLLISACACNSASKRRAKREYERELKMLREQEAKSREVKQIKAANRAPVSFTTPTATTTVTAPKASNGEPISQNGKTGKDSAALDVTTHL